ncbi:MAG: calcium-binding protein [Phycisphaerae bacterium]
MSPSIEIIAQDNNRCGESPIWDPTAGRLLWVDNASDLVFQYTPATGQKEVISRGLNVGGIALNADGRLVFAGATGLYLWRSPDDVQVVAQEYAGEKLFFNDIIAGPGGQVYAGTLYWGANGMEKLGKLYLFDLDGSVRVVDEGIELSNGMGFSPDDRTLYYSDSSARKIYAYDVDPDSGDLSNRRVVVQVPRDEGIPDGMTVDREGFLWSAQWYGSQIVRYDPDGAVERRIAMPAKQTSSCIFGGPDWMDLYVTSAGESWVGEYAPPGYDFSASNIGGALYRLRPGEVGRPEHVARLGLKASTG